MNSKFWNFMPLSFSCTNIFRLKLWVLVKTWLLGLTFFEKKFQKKLHTKSFPNTINHYDMILVYLVKKLWNLSRIWPFSCHIMLTSLKNLIRIFFYFFRNFLWFPSNGVKFSIFSLHLFLKILDNVHEKTLPE